MIKAVVFDFDYTLGDSTEGIVQSINYAMGRLARGMYGRDDIVKTIGLSLAKAYEVLTGREEPDEVMLFEKYFVEKADEVMVINSVLYPGVVEMLFRLHDRGIKTGIVTTKYHYRIEQIISVHGISHLIDGIVGGEDVRHVKPDPEGLVEMAKILGVDRGEMLYVGDHVVDAEAARAAGVDFVAVLTGTAGEEAFQPFPHLGIVGEAKDILPLVL